MTDINNDIIEVNDQAVTVSSVQDEATRGGFGYDPTFGAVAGSAEVLDGSAVLASIQDDTAKAQAVAADGVFDDVLAGSVAEVVAYGEANPDDIDALLVAEAAGKNRVGVFKGLERN